jgi:hypothetical protein
MALAEADLNVVEGAKLGRKRKYFTKEAEDAARNASQQRYRRKKQKEQQEEAARKLVGFSVFYRIGRPVANRDYLVREQMLVGDFTALVAKDCGAQVQLGFARDSSSNLTFLSDDLPVATVKGHSVYAVPAKSAGIPGTGICDQCFGRGPDARQYCQRLDGYDACLLCIVLKNECTFTGVSQERPKHKDYNLPLPAGADCNVRVHFFIFRTTLSSYSSKLS